ncbi:IS630 transposase-related protein, partial [Psychrobacter sp.]
KGTLQRWLIDPSIQTTRVKAPTNIPNEALLKDINQYLDDYLYERSRRLNYNKSDIGYALKKLNIYQKDICYVTMP